MKPISKHYTKMNFYLLFIMFLYIGGCSARVVPLDFKFDTSEPFDSSTIEHELVDKSPSQEVIGHSLPDIEESKDFNVMNSKENTTSVPEISNGNSSNLSVDLTRVEKAIEEQSDLQSNDSSAISNLLEELDSTSEFESKNGSDSGDTFEILRVNGTLKDKKFEDLTLTHENSISNSLRDVGQENNIDFVITEEFLEDKLEKSETLEVARSDQNETLEVARSDQNETLEVARSDQNETLEVVNSINSIGKFIDMQPLPNDTHFEILLNSTESVSEEFKSNNLTSKHIEVTNGSLKTAGGIFSGFEFLINSEVARNAAKAMEVFNFSDPLTDHIMEENEFHSFLPAFNAVEVSGAPDQANEIRSNFNASFVSENGTSIMQNHTELEETKIDSLMSGNKSELLNLAIKSEGNITSEVLNSLESSAEKIALASETALSEENVDTVTDLNPVGVPKCPPSGWCIFWFLAQDTCALNKHCLGNRICCKIGCANTCIEVEVA